VKTFGIRLHQSVFNSVVDHLDEVPGAGRPAIEITLLSRAACFLPPRGERDIANARRKRLEDRIEVLNRVFWSADHHAVAAIDTPDAAAGADINVVDLAILQL